MLNTDDDADYPAYFRYTNDSRWVVRMQKTGSGEASLYLYKLTDKGFVSATKKLLGDLAWAYFKSRPESRKAKTPDFHISAGLVEGTEQNYRNLGVNWPENRYLVITLWGEVEPTEHHHQLSTVRGWHVRYISKPASSTCRRNFERAMPKRSIPRASAEGHSNLPFPSRSG